MIKYCGYYPNSYKGIEIRVKEYNKEYEEIKAKKYVYRGYNNLKLLKDFYEKLIMYCQSLIKNNFEEN